MWAFLGKGSTQQRSVLRVVALEFIKAINKVLSKTKEYRQQKLLHTAILDALDPV